jgi:hypothetical protein
MNNDMRVYGVMIERHTSEGGHANLAASAGRAVHRTTGNSEVA